MARTQNNDSRKKLLEEKVINLSRVTKVTKGGRHFRFSATVAVGNRKGLVGIGSGKANEVPDGIKKASEKARKNQFVVPMVKGGTIPHTVIGRHGACRVFLKPAPEGTGVIAGGPMRAVFEVLGIKDVVAKSLGSVNPHNMIRATFEAFRQMATPKSVAVRRGKTISEVTASRNAVEITKENV